MLSDSPTTASGYATVTRNILNGISKEFECHCIGHNYFGQTIVPPIKFEDGENIKFKLHGAGMMKYSMDNIRPLIEKYEIDIFGILLDTFMMMDAGFMELDTSPAKTFFYYPSDGGVGLPAGCENILRKIDVPISMSKYGQAQVQKKYGINSAYIPHGYDPKLFYPLSDKEKTENRLKWQLQDKFVVGTVARNQGRKMLDRTLKSFKLFCRDNLTPFY